MNWAFPKECESSCIAGNYELKRQYNPVAPYGIAEVYADSLLKIPPRTYWDEGGVTVYQSDWWSRVHVVCSDGSEWDVVNADPASKSKWAVGSILGVAAAHELGHALGLVAASRGTSHSCQVSELAPVSTCQGAEYRNNAATNDCDKFLAARNQVMNPLLMPGIARTAQQGFDWKLLLYLRRIIPKQPEP